MEFDEVDYYEQLIAEQEAIDQEDIAALLEIEVQNSAEKNIDKSKDSSYADFSDEEFPLVISEQVVPGAKPEDNIGQKRKYPADAEFIAQAEEQPVDNPPKKLKSIPIKEIVLEIPPINCESVKLVGQNGIVRYLRKRTNLENPTFSNQSINFMGVGLQNIRIEAYKERQEAEKRWEAQTKTQKKTNATASKVDWISQYRARQYTELLSDEVTNRAILKWLKMWEQCVFKIKRKVRKTKDVQESFGRKFGGNGRKMYKTREQLLEERAEEENEADEFGRPKYKVLMLSGPPGLGKTTLAHVAATHSGYRPTEINASDDRSGENFKNQVNQALTNQNATDRRPNCLILDEIDGIHVASTNYLIKRIAAQKIVKSEEKKSRKKDTFGPLVRPIICICNDPYVPALRELREHTLILYFDGVDRSRLTSRLEDVCKINSVKIDRSALMKLTVKTEDDIRSCINALQFLSMNNNDKTVTMADIDKVNMGKDQQRGIQYALKEILTVGTAQSINERYMRSIEVSRSFGDSGKLINTIFESVDQIKPTGLESIAQSRNWYTWYDRIESYIGRSQNYQLYGVKEFIVPALHLLLAQTGGSHDTIKISKNSWDVYRRKLESENLMKMMKMGISIDAKSSFYGNGIVLQLPILLKICEPAIRSVNPALWSKNEKEAIQHCVNVMVDLGISLKQYKNRETQLTDFELEPPVSQVAQFPSDSTVKILTLSNSTKTLLAAEIDREKIRRSHAARVNRVKQMNQTAETISPAMRAVIMPPKAKPIGKDKFVIPKKGAFSSFVRTSRPLSEVKKVENAAKVIDPGIGNSAIFYKYNAGYSNAVRQVIRIKELI